jgi:hypothetical protein
MLNARAMKIAAGVSSARSEVSRLVTEKVSAGAEAVGDFDERAARAEESFVATGCA